MKMAKKKIKIDTEKELNEPKLVYVPEQTKQPAVKEADVPRPYVLKGFYIEPAQHDALTRLVGKLQSKGQTREDGNQVDRSAVVREAIRDIFEKYAD